MPQLYDARRRQRRSAKSISSSSFWSVCMLACVSGTRGGGMSVLAANCAVAQQSLNQLRRLDQGLDLAKSVQLLGLSPLAPLSNRSAGCSTSAWHRSVGSQRPLLAASRRDRRSIASPSVHGCLGVMDALLKLPRALDCIVLDTVRGIRKTLRIVHRVAHAVCRIGLDQSALIIMVTIDLTERTHHAYQPAHRSATANAVFVEWGGRRLIANKVWNGCFFNPQCAGIIVAMFDATRWTGLLVTQDTPSRHFVPRTCAPSIQSKAPWSARCQRPRRVPGAPEFWMARMVLTTKVSA